MPYIDCFYVCEDIAHRGPLNIKKFDTLDTAVEVYKALPSGTVKAPVRSPVYMAWPARSLI